MNKKVESVVNLRKGSYVVYDGVACRVSSIQTSRPGKHGHAKCRVAVIGMIDKRKRIFIKPGHDKIDVPIIEKKNAQILSVSGETANVMDMGTYETFDLKIPNDLKDEVKEGSTVLYWVMLDEKIIKEVKNGQF